MTHAPTIIERAYELARSGECASHNEIALRLKSERFDNVDAHLGFPAIRRTLRSLCKTAVSERETPAT